MSDLIERDYQSALAEIKRWKNFTRGLEQLRQETVLKRRREQIRFRAEISRLKRRNDLLEEVYQSILEELNIYTGPKVLKAIVSVESLDRPSKRL